MQSDRDVSSQVPINFVPHPGVYVTAACFGNNVYENDGVEKCLSNLLSSQIRRYVLDIYWDTVNRRFALCPVEIPGLSRDTSQNFVYERSIVDVTAMASGSITARQTMPTSGSNTTSNATQSSITETSTAASYSVISSGDGTRVLQLGPYQCSDTLTLKSIALVFSQFFTKTANNIDAKIILWVLNLHVASTADQPVTQRTNLPSALLPNATESVTAYIEKLEDILYGPDTLFTDRQNLNSSWFHRGSEDVLPLTTYFDTSNDSDGDIVTDSGWPDEEYIQIKRGRRMLIGFGDIDSGMSDYNMTMDASLIYPSNYISNKQNVTFQGDGRLTSGCYYDTSASSISQLNNSWAVATINSIDPPDLGVAADNLTSCGISQLLNVTIGKMTADAAAGPYQDFGNNAIFSWAYGQPQNDTAQGVEDNQNFRCALMMSTDAYRGHWRVEYCSERRRVACREAESPYRWQISDFKVPYASGDAACTGNTSFDVPRTGLENTYLYNKILDDAEDDDSLLDGVWINFNSLDYQDCWVTTGVNGTCPYYQDASATQSRHILIPALAALIVLILSALTVLVKCTSNARNSKNRRRGDGGWDYEGVPS